MPIISTHRGMNEQKQQDIRKRQPIRLPFEKRETDIGVWFYDHRIGICVTLAAYVIFMGLFAWGTISLDKYEPDASILIEFPEEEKRIELTPEQQRILAQSQQDDYSDVRNASSNDNADELDPHLADDRSTQASQLYEDAGKLGESMDANRALYEQGLALERAIANGDKGNETESGERKDMKISGNVTVRFSFANPVRNKVSLVVPAYLCEGGGMVELMVTLDTNGYVVSATVDKSVSTPDECMQNSAMNAARQSRFNVDPSAPKRQTGTISYTFIPQ